MCGIIGFTGLYDKLTAQRMNAALAHRGPDDEGFFFDSRVALGNRRLKIIDLSSAGKQPLSNEDETVWVTFNGEIYNHRELRAALEARGHRFKSRADTEVLVHGFEEWGAALPKKLRGDFAFAVWDSRRKKLFLARDHLGVCPLYYSFYDLGNRKKGIAFASEIKALLLHPFVKREVDLRALNEYLSLQYSLGPNTLFAGIKKLQPGSSLEFDAIDANAGECAAREYWNFEFAGGAVESEESIARKIVSLAYDAVKVRLMSDVPLGAYLSGGLDSSFVVALMARAAREAGEPSDSVKTFSVGFGQETDETKFARLVADECATRHEELFVDASQAVKEIPRVAWHLDEPAADAAAIPTFLMARAVKPHATVVLTGDGGDEVFGGYARYSRLPRISKFGVAARAAAPLVFLARAFTTRAAANRLAETLRAAGDRATLFLAYASAFSEGEKKEFLAPKTLEEFAAFPSLVEEVKPFFGKRGKREKRESFENELFYFDLKTLLPDDYLLKVNKMSMAHSVESRVPLLDKALVEFSAAIPPALKVDASRTKKIMRKAMRGLVPKRVVERGKWGFNVPTRAWLSGELGEVAAQLLGEDAARKRGYFKNRVAQSVLRNYSRNEKYYSRQFWVLFALELWHRLFVDAPLEKIAQPSKSFDELL